MKSLALLFILCPWLAPRHAPEPLWKELKAVSSQLQLVAEHEMWSDNFAGEVRYAHRVALLLHNAPPIEDCRWLPSLAEVCASQQMNHSFQKYLAEQWALQPEKRGFLRPIVLETRRLDSVLQQMRVARYEGNVMSCRRQALAGLRDLVGPAAYAGHAWPPPVPLWRYEEMDR
jgi:hypothetical protein